jgi:hypothetical protein
LQMSKVTLVCRQKVRKTPPKYPAAWHVLTI